MTHTPVALPGPRRVPVFLPETLPEVDPELLPDRGGSGDSGGWGGRPLGRVATGLVLALATWGCGGEAEPDAAMRGERPSLAPATPPAPLETPAPWRGLLPADAFAYVQMESLDAFVAATDRVAGPALGPAPGSSEWFASLTPVSFDASLVARDRPLAAAFRFVGGEPRPTFVLPATDAEALAASVRGGSAIVQGDVVGLSAEADYQEGAPAALTVEPLPGGALAARIDLEAVVSQYRMFIEMGMAAAKMQVVQQMEAAPVGVDAGGMFDAYAGMLRTMLDEVRRLDVAWTSDGDALRVSGALEVRADGPLAGFPKPPPADLAALASVLDARSDYLMVARGDLEQITLRGRDAMGTLMGSLLGGEAGSSWDEMITEWSVVYRLCDGALAGDGTFDGAGQLQMRYLAASSQAPMLRDAYLAVLQGLDMGPLGVVLGEAEERTVDGVAVTHVPYEMDPAALFGSEDPEFRAEMERVMSTTYGEDLGYDVFESAGRVALVQGSDSEALVRSTLASLGEGGRSVPPSLAPWLPRLEATDAGVVLTMDLGAVMNAALTGAQGLPPGQQPPEGPLEMAVFVGVEGARWGFDLAVDSAQLSALTAR